MAQSEVFKACLGLFKQESSLLGDKGLNSHWNEQEITAMGIMFDNLSNVFKTTMVDDRLKVFPHIVAIVNRSIQRCISSDLRIINIKALVSCIGCLQEVLSLLLVGPNTRFAESISVVTSQDILLKILLLDIALFEILKNSLQSQIALVADEEHLSMLCCALLHSILSAYSHTPTSVYSIKLVDMLQGNLLAQAIQSVLVFAQSKNKSISQQSLQCLLVLFGLLQSDAHQREWRNFFPGIFSGLYALCLSGYKR